jgi:hypothetical protein
MKTSNVLKFSKKYLGKNLKEINSCYGDKNRFICNAIEIAFEADKVSWKEYKRVRAIISERLDNYITLEHWLRSKHNIGISKFSVNRRYAAYIKKMQTTRHAWIDSMIAEFAAKGD